MSYFQVDHFLFTHLKKKSYKKVERREKRCKKSQKRILHVIVFKIVQYSYSYLQSICFNSVLLHNFV